MPDVRKDRLFSGFPVGFAALAGVCAVLAGVAVLIGWQWRVEYLKTPFPATGSSAMTPNGALCFILLGVALWLRRHRSAPRTSVFIAGACATLVLAFSTLSLLQYLTDREAGIDTLFFRHRLSDWTMTSPPGRLPANSALAFLLLSLGLLLLGRKLGNLRLTEGLSLGAGLIAFFGVLGYAYDVPYLTGVGHVGKMGLHTAITFCVLAAGVFFARSHRGLASRFLSRDLDGVVARRLLLTLVVVLPLFGWFTLQLENRGIVEREFGMTLLVGATVIVVGIFIVRTAQVLHHAIARRRVAEQSLRRHSDELDIAHRAAENDRRRLERLNRTLKALNDSNEALLHAGDETTLLQQVCRIITEDCGHSMVWIGYADNDEQKSVRPVAHAGFEEGYLATLGISWADTERGRGPTGTAIRTGQPCHCRHMHTDPKFAPWRQEALRRGYASSLALPLISEDKAFGAVTLYAREPDAFSDDEVKLLAELVADLAYGLSSLRLRVAHERTAAALQQSEEQLRVATLAAEIGVWSWIPGTGHVIVSANWRRLFGVGPDELVTFETWRDALHPDDRARAVAELNAASELHREFNTEYRVVRRDGTVRWIVDRGRASYAEDGRPVGMAGINLDITERKRAEEALQHASEHRRLALEAADLGAWDYHFTTGDVYWDERCRNMFGVATGDQIGYEGAIARIHPDDRSAVDAAVRNAIAGVQGGAYHIEFRVVWPDESVHWVASHGRVHFEGEGEQRHPVRFIGVNSDITERKQAEQALIQGEKLASVGRMAATIAHEINNPLAAIINALYLVSMDKSLSQNARLNLRLAEEELDRVVQITKTTLGFYRESAGPIAVPLPELMESVLALYRRKLREKNITVSKRYDSDNGEVCGSSGEIRQVLSNLLANSLDAVAPGGTIQVRISGIATAGGRAVRLTIADNGAGIRTDHLKKIFDPFFTTKEAFGTGLGLWVSREIVSKYGGTIRVRSREGKGTVFCITFPRAATKTVAAGAGKAALASD